MYESTKSCCVTTESTSKRSHVSPFSDECSTLLA